MRAGLVNINFKAFNKQCSGLLALLREALFGRLIVKCLEILHNAYSNHCTQAWQTANTYADKLKIEYIDTRMA
jgi:hypothetical protein